MKLSDREIGTILAGLRERQNRLENRPTVGDELEDVATNGGDFVPLTADEIDDLCERLNFGTPRTEPGPLECLLIEALDIVSVVAHPESGEDPAETGPEAAKLEPRIRAVLNRRRRKRESAKGEKS